jgi:AAA+ ATPase superfamily predicted ATPase
MFIDRAAELAFLTSVLTRTHPGPGQLIMLYGRRRVGKTALLRYWAEQSGAPFTYWVAAREPAPLQRRKLFTELLRTTGTNLPTPDVESWSDLWDAVATLVRDQRQLLILDEFPYAADSDAAMLSSLQHAWDRYFQQSRLVIATCGSHVRTMELLFGRQSPLFGRMTGQWRLMPLPFGVLHQFLPGWSSEELVATYAIVGGVPAYLAWLNPMQTLVENIKQVMLAPGSLVLAEAMFLLQDEVREPRNYLAILQAIGSGAHSLSEIANASMISTVHLSAYLAQLQDLRLVERRLPATVPPSRQHRSRMGRYHLSDPFLRFHFRFLEPYASDGSLSYQPERVLPAMVRDLRAFVGSTAWEELSRQWVLAQRTTNVLAFMPEVVGSHWSRMVQIDVVAINWQTHDILLGECKWGADTVDRATVRELIEKTPLVLADLPNAGANWRVHYALFTRAGATSAARQELAKHAGLVIDLARLDRDLTAAEAQA